MCLSRRQIQSLYLPGTVSMPPAFPQVAEIFFEPAAIVPGRAGGGAAADALRVVQNLSSKLTIARTFFLEDVAAVFLPEDPETVSLNSGQWLLGGEIRGYFAAAEDAAGGPAVGIVYVRETANCLMHVEVGMTAAESAEYYPPLPGDRTVDHYRLHPEMRAMGLGCDPCGM